MKPKRDNLSSVARRACSCASSLLLLAAFPGPAIIGERTQAAAAPPTRPSPACDRAAMELERDRLAPLVPLAPNLFTLQFFATSGGGR